MSDKQQDASMNTAGGKVGVEIEFLGVSMPDAAAVIAKQLGTKVIVETEHEHRFDTEHGTYRLEVDFELLQRLGREAAETKSDDPWRDVAVDALAAAASVATPLELVTPPLLREQLPQLNATLNALAAAGAKGTGESILYAFGVHFNPEADLASASITAHLQAFLCLYDWLSMRDNTDLTRILSAFALPFSEDYESMVLQPDYSPGQSQLIDDYQQFNPSRNRALDLLPLFMHVDAKRVGAAIDDVRVNARPTYHYRLPNSRVGEKHWSLQQPWQDWLVVEAMARSAHHLHQLCAARLTHNDQGVFAKRRNDWITECHIIVDNLRAA